MNVTHCQCNTVTSDKTLVNTNTSFIHSPLSKTIMKSQHKPKQVRFQLPPRYYHHQSQFKAEIEDNTTPIYKAALDSAATTNCFPAKYRGTNYQPHTKPSDAIIAQTANDTVMASIATDQLNAPQLPSIARRTHLSQ